MEVLRRKNLLISNLFQDTVFEKQISFIRVTEKKGENGFKEYIDELGFTNRYEFALIKVNKSESYEIDFESSSDNFDDFQPKWELNFHINNIIDSYLKHHFSEDEIDFHIIYCPETSQNKDRVANFYGIFDGRKIGKDYSKVYKRIIEIEANLTKITNHLGDLYERELEILDRHKSLESEFFKKRDLGAYLDHLSEKKSNHLLIKVTSFFSLLNPLNLIERKKNPEWAWNYLLLWFYREFSWFGTSIFRPLAVGFAIHLILFALLLLNNQDIAGLSSTTLCFSFENCSFDYELLAFYFYTFNPIHTLKNGSNNEIYSVVDFFMRISSSYFIYYFLQATRKFGRNF